MNTLPRDYEQRVYAGVLGKIIGVYLGRPFEGWSNKRIEEELGEVNYYVHERLNHPLIVSDDDISGTFTFLRALPDHGLNPNLKAKDIGETWLNYLIDKRTILWWGGMGVSTEHTAYLRLKSGISAPQSGSIALNGAVVAEQIGAHRRKRARAIDVECAAADREFAGDRFRGHQRGNRGVSCMGLGIRGGVENDPGKGKMLNRLRSKR
jgi:hypothetical protein